MLEGRRGVGSGRELDERGSALTRECGGGVSESSTHGWRWLGEREKEESESSRSRRAKFARARRQRSRSLPQTARSRRLEGCLATLIDCLGRAHHRHARTATRAALRRRLQPSQLAPRTTAFTRLERSWMDGRRMRQC